MENLLFNLSYLLYTVSLALYLTYLGTKKERITRVAFTALGMALAIHCTSLVLRATSVAPEHIYFPFSNWYECFSIFGGIIALIYFVISLAIHIPLLGVFILPVGWALLSMAFFSDKTVHPLIPELHSRWIVVHVPVMFAAYSIFAVAFAVGVAYLLAERQMKSKQPGLLSYHLPSLEDLDKLISRLVMAALPLLTIGIILGGLWAYSAWGRYWGWDPKETWALITWLVYVTYLGLRQFGGWRGRKSAYLSLAGFAIVLFTYVGVNYMSPLHGFLSVSGR